MVQRSDNLVISAALAGAVTRKDQNEATPYSPEEFGDEAKRCYDAGAAIVHIHARDESGLPTPEIDRIRETLENIKEKAPDIIINLSTAISINATDRERIKPVRTFKPPLASLNTNSMNFSVANWKTGEIVMAAGNVFTNNFKTIQKFARHMQKAGTKPEMEIYDMGGLYNMLLLNKQEGMFEQPLHFQCVFGVCGGIPFTPTNFAHFLNDMPENATWSVCGVANQQFQAALCAIGWGGHVRVGLEDNIRMPDGELAKGSWEQVKWAKMVAEASGRKVVQGAEARKEFNIINDSVTL
ncbi:MAG: 3-keto-5-aminohexanoate cleavage protein [Candidatus Lokiarchaeota archaeon]|nr:3-keto-5-aminohexanoate cleavage protein [Candidatus Lokiarchaeota archaeon]MBD3200867.1 3-keto-5-aminohexanoate cleavage protein [Candidatus Lokiarchaeota archaeon]